MTYIPRPFLYITVTVIIWFFYNGLLIVKYNHFRNETDKSNYFKYLSESFIHGKTDVTLYPNSTYHDISLYQGKHYLYWPPVPALVYVPFVLLFGLDTPDQLIMSLIGALNALLMMFLARKFVDSYKIPVNDIVIACVGLFWALGTVHFYMSMDARVWFVSQILAQTFLLCSLIFFLNKISYKNFFLSGLFFGLACYTRNDLIFCAFLYIAIYFTLHSRAFTQKTVVDAIAYILPFAILSFANLYYNYIRFGDFSNNGVMYHKMAPRFYEDYIKYGFMSLHYIPYNFYVEVISLPAFRSKVPFFVNDSEGFGFLWASPVFLLIIPWFIFYAVILIKRIKQKAISTLKNDDLLVIGSCFLSAFLICFTILTVMGPGWAQFAARYTLDFQLLLILFLLFMFKQFPGSKTLAVTCVVLLLFSVYINYAGTIYFNQLDPRFQPAMR